MIETLNKVLTKNIQFVLTCKMHTKLNIADMMSLFYYYKHSQVMYAF